MDTADTAFAADDDTSSEEATPPAPTLLDHIASLAKNAAECSMGPEASHFANAAFQLAEAHGIIEQSKLNREDWIASQPAVVTMTSPETAQAEAPGKPGKSAGKPTTA